MGRLVFLQLSFRQAKWLLTLLDALQLVFKTNTPMELISIRKSLFDSMYPDRAN